MIKVWTDGAEAGLLDRSDDRGSAFIYLPETISARVAAARICKSYRHV